MPTDRAGRCREAENPRGLVGKAATEVPLVFKALLAFRLEREQ